jgi:hypothetical protein
MRTVSEERRAIRTERTRDQESSPAVEYEAAGAWRACANRLRPVEDPARTVAASERPAVTVVRRRQSNDAGARRTKRFTPESILLETHPETCCSDTFSTSPTVCWFFYEFEPSRNPDLNFFARCESGCTCESDQNLGIDHDTRHNTLYTSGLLNFAVCADSKISFEPLLLPCHLASGYHSFRVQR